MESKTFSGKEKLSALKELMKKNNIQAYVIPHDDAHFVEFSKFYLELTYFDSG